MEYILLIVGAALVNNLVLSQFLGVCPLPGASSRVETALGLSGAITLVMTLATLAAHLLQSCLLTPLGLGYLQTIVFVLMIAALVQAAEPMLKRLSPALHQALGIFLPSITTGCAVLGLALLTIQKGYTLAAGMVFSVASSLGFGLVMVLFAGIREALELNSVPKPFRGLPIALITAGILAMAFMGFSGVGK